MIWFVFQTENYYNLHILLDFSSYSCYPWNNLPNNRRYGLGKWNIAFYVYDQNSTRFNSKIISRNFIIYILFQILFWNPPND